MNEAQLENLARPLRERRIVLRFQKHAGVSSIALYTGCDLRDRIETVEVKTLGAHVDRGGVRFLSEEYDLARAVREWPEYWQTSAETLCIVKEREEPLWHPTVLIHLATLRGILLERLLDIDRVTDDDQYRALKALGKRIEGVLNIGTRKWEPIFALSQD